MLDVIVADTEVFPKYFLLVAKTLIDKAYLRLHRTSWPTGLSVLI